MPQPAQEPAFSCMFPLARRFHAYPVMYVGRHGEAASHRAIGRSKIRKIRQADRKCGQLRARPRS
jgi:hypothetical protein